MASPSTPTHGKFGTIYRQRPNNFQGTGLNDVTWGTGFTGAATAYYEVEIDGELAGGGGVDTFQWRKNGGGWTTDVDISGAAQTLDDTQTITFAATTGHTLGDQWTIGNFKDEATTEATVYAQITTAAYRYLNLNSLPTFTDDGGKNVLIIDPVRGQATFDGNVGNVDVDGNNGFIVQSGLQEVGYLIGWTLDIAMDVSEITDQGDQWKTFIPGQTGGTGSAQGWFIGRDTLHEILEDCIDATQLRFLVEFYNYDPDSDQTGDHFTCWITMNGYSLNPSKDGGTVMESVNFTLQHIPMFTANS